MVALDPMTHYMDMLGVLTFTALFYYFFKVFFFYNSAWFTVKFVSFDKIKTFILFL